MDSFEWNKIAGAILFALLVAFGLSIFSEIVFHSEAPETPGYVIAVAEEGEGAGEAAAAEPIGVLMAGADPAAGASAAKKCLACHTFGEGEADKVGPNLWGVLMQPIAAHEGYSYSDAMREHAEEAHDWTYEHLDAYLTNPKGVVPGTKMLFPGLKNDAERANVIAYLRTLSENPAPLPEPEASETEETEGAAAPEGSGEATEPAEPATEPATEEQQGAAEPATEEQQGAAEPATEQEAAATEEAEEPAAPEEQVASAEAPAAMPAGDPAKGEAYAKRCLACHSFAEGGPNKVGPPLFGVFGRPIASLPAYAYSDAMTAFSEGGTKTWDAETLDTYLINPRDDVPGSKMVFPGIKKDEDRANLIAYLATLKP
jgi:cytochrome c2